jgi:hypothetical protein
MTKEKSGEDAVVAYFKIVSQDSSRVWKKLDNLVSVTSSYPDRESNPLLHVQTSYTLPLIYLLGRWYQAEWRHIDTADIFDKYSIRN